MCFIYLQAEDFDEGGEGIAYHDTTAGDEGKTNYRKVLCWALPLGGIVKR